MGVITVALIKYLTGEYDVELVRRLAIVGQDIREIENLEDCVNLEELSLSNNQISRLTGLECLTKLVRLDLSCNRISQIESIDALPDLEYLDLRGNQISNLEQIDQLSKLPRLTSLFLKDYDNSNANPVCKHPSYFHAVRRYLPQLEVLDGESLRMREMADDRLGAFLRTMIPDEEARKTPPRRRWLKGIVEEVSEEQRPHRRNNSLEMEDDLIKETATIMNAVNDIEKLEAQLHGILSSTQDDLDQLNLGE